MPSIIAMNPFRCRMWEFHDRLEPLISERSCQAEIASFSKHGQFVAVLGRELHGDQCYDVELITGARRLFVARHLNKPLAVEVRALSDKEAFIAMDAENRLRKDISPYERALSYSQWLRSGQFESQDDIARALKISASQVSRVLSLSQLPAVIIEAFADPTQIREQWGVSLLARLNDVGTRQAMLERARALITRSRRGRAQEVYRELLAAPGSGRTLRRPHHDHVVRGENGESLFRICHRRDSIAFLLPVERLAQCTVREITEAVVRILRPANKQVDDSTVVPRKKPTDERRSFRTFPSP